jgi:hypothetical protein
MVRIEDRFYVGPRELPSGGFLNRKRRRPEDEPSDPVSMKIA